VATVVVGGVDKERIKKKESEKGKN
jgi:hypothetical protein